MRPESVSHRFERPACSGDDVRLLVLIPTRNRADLVGRTINSVLRAADGVQILVSDNSTSAQHQQDLATFCRQFDDPRVHYLRPANPMALAPHWEWAIQQALHSFDFSHVLLVSDRTFAKRGHLERVRRLAASCPDRVISFRYDSLQDDVTPIRLFQQSRTERVFEVSSSELLANVADLRVATWYFIPIMANCLVPRSVLEGVQNRFGNIFASRMPDLCFGFRCLEVLESIVCYDTTPMVDYAVARSKSVALTRGQVTEAYTDWRSHLDGNGTDAGYMTPIPELQTLTNLILHEYAWVKAESRSSKFPPLDRAAYFRANENEVRQMRVSPARSENQSILDAQAHVFPPSARRHRPGDATARRWWPAMLERIAWRLTRHPKRFWGWMERYGLYFPAGVVSRITFDTLDAALHHAAHSPRPRNRMWCELEVHTRAKRLSWTPAGDRAARRFETREQTAP